MAERKKLVGRPFKKGQSGNPKGSSAKSRRLGAIGKLTVAELEEVGALLLKGDREALAHIGQNPKSSVLQVWTAGLIVHSMKEGDASIYRAILDRIVGKPRETMEVSGKDGSPIEVRAAHAHLTELEKKQRADELAKVRLEVGED